LLNIFSFENDGLRSVGELAQEIYPGMSVYFVHFGDDGGADRTATFYGNVTEQLAEACEAIANEPELAAAPAINALGFSQGGQFLRGYVERCNAPPVATLVTMGAQHNGISEFRECEATDWVCRGAEGLLRGNTWSNWVQAHLVPAQYFRDPEDLESYLESSNWLADVNNEREEKNLFYIANMRDLERFVMYIFSEDTTAIPKESAWFSEVNRTSGEVTKLQDRKMYEEDWLGLKFLDEQGRLEFNTAEGKHMNITEDLLRDIFKKYFGPDEDDNASLEL
jgi:palmitoyl-protein thioesterase